MVGFLTREKVDVVLTCDLERQEMVGHFVDLQGPAEQRQRVYKKTWC